jgi:hypothetical protein
VSGFEQRGKNGQEGMKKDGWKEYEYMKTEKNDERKKEQDVLGRTDRLLPFDITGTA